MPVGLFPPAEPKLPIMQVWALSLRIILQQKGLCGVILIARRIDASAKVQPDLTFSGSSLLNDMLNVFN